MKFTSPQIDRRRVFLLYPYIEPGISPLHRAAG
jgi:hypothetical protein